MTYRLKKLSQLYLSVLVGSTSGVVKSLFPLSRKIRAIRLHKPLLTPNNYISADGKEFKESNNEDEHAATGCYSGAFIYHRFYRSETEYVSSLFRLPQGKQVYSKFAEYVFSEQKQPQKYRIESVSAEQTNLIVCVYVC